MEALVILELATCAIYSVSMLWVPLVNISGCVGVTGEPSRGDEVPTNKDPLMCK